VRGDGERLRDILEAIAKIGASLTVSKETFLADEMLQVWMIHHLQIIGEAAARLSAELRNLHPGVPWEEIVAMRNILVHQYFGVDLEEVWTTVTADIPRLGQHLARILEEQG
jgi:uncharacterized protein with HEPN domain